MPVIPTRAANTPLQLLPARLTRLPVTVSVPLKVGQLVPCKRCGVQFRLKIIKQKWCSDYCREAQYEEDRPIPRYPKEAVCEHCGSSYMALGPVQRWCSAACRIAYHAKRKPIPIVGKVIHRSRYPRGGYVYGWYKDDDKLPFYIGKGVYDRAWRKHLSTDRGMTAACQDVRRNCENFRVVVYRDGLTEEGALLVESLLIEVFRSLGACLLNQKIPVKRRAKSTLELQQCR